MSTPSPAPPLKLTFRETADGWFEARSKDRRYFIRKQGPGDWRWLAKGETPSTARTYGDAVAYCEAHEAHASGGKARSIRKRPAPDGADPSEWKLLQDQVMREFLAEIGRRRIRHRDMCAEIGISSSYWSEMLNLKRPASLDIMLRVAFHLGLSLSLSFSRPKHEPESA